MINNIFPGSSPWKASVRVTCANNYFRAQNIKLFHLSLWFWDKRVSETETSAVTNICLSKVTNCLTSYRGLQYLEVKSLQKEYARLGVIVFKNIFKSVFAPGIRNRITVNYFGSAIQPPFSVLRYSPLPVARFLNFSWG